MSGDPGVIRHVVEVKHHRAWNEWRPDCECGWTGSYWTNRSYAVAEGEGHAMWVTPPDNGATPTTD